MGLISQLSPLRTHDAFDALRPLPCCSYKWFFFLCLLFPPKVLRCHFSHFVLIFICTEVFPPSNTPRFRQSLLKGCWSLSPVDSLPHAPVKAQLCVPVHVHFRFCFTDMFLFPARPMWSWPLWLQWIQSDLSYLTHGPEFSLVPLPCVRILKSLLGQPS